MARPRKIPSLDSSVWAAALDGLEMQRARIDEQIRQVRAMMGQPRRGRPPASTSAVVPTVAAAVAATTAPAPKGKKRVLSAAARKRIAAAQKKRWAEFREKSEAPAE